LKESVPVEPVLVKTEQIELSGLLARPDGQPERGLIVALHGGAYTSGYWHFRGGNGTSLLEIGAALGYWVLALDRPGYGASRNFDTARLGLVSQVELLFDAIEAWRSSSHCAGPVYLIGHSVGGILSLLMAANVRAGMLGGVDVLGVPMGYPPTDAGEEVNSWLPEGSHIPVIDDRQRKWLLFGPEGTYDAEAFKHDGTCLSPMSVAEYRDSLAMPASWAEVLPSIRTPVQYSLAEYEAIVLTGWAALDKARGLLRNSTNCIVHLQKGSGHNSSAHSIARAYHLRAIAFFLECEALKSI